MARKITKKAILKREYGKERSRLKQTLKRLEKRGYLIPDNVLPPIPKRITQASVNRLTKIRPKELYEKIEYLDQETGEILTGSRGRILERKKAAEKRQKTISNKKATEKRKKIDKKKSATKSDGIDTTVNVSRETLTEDTFSRIVIDNFRETISKLPRNISDKILYVLNTLIREQGITNVATSLLQQPKQFYEYLNQIGYTYNDAINQWSQSIVNYLPDASEPYKEDVMEKFDEYEGGYFDYE